MRCTAITTRGTQCFKHARSGDRVCWHHRNTSLSYPPKNGIKDSGVWTPPKDWTVATFLQHLQTGHPKILNTKNVYLCICTDGKLHAFVSANNTKWAQTRASIRQAIQTMEFKRDIVDNPKVTAVLMSSNCLKYIRAVLPYDATIEYLVKHFKEYFDSHSSKVWLTRTDDRGLDDMEYWFLKVFGQTCSSSQLNGMVISVVPNTPMPPYVRLELKARGAKVLKRVTADTTLVLVPKPLPDLTWPYSRSVQFAINNKILLATPNMLGDWMSGRYNTKKNTKN